MTGKVSRLTSAEVFKILKRHNFTLISQLGSHQKWRNHQTGKQIIVPQHKGKHLPIGTLRSIIDGSGISEEDFH